MGEEPGPHVRPGQQAAGQDQDLQEADRGGRGDRRPQPGQVPQGSAGAGGDRGPCQDGRDCSPRLPLSLNTQDTKIWIRTSLLDNQCSTFYLLPMLYEPTSFLKLTCLCLRM